MTWPKCFWLSWTQAVTQLQTIAQQAPQSPNDLNYSTNGSANALVLFGN